MVVAAWSCQGVVLAADAPAKPAAEKAAPSVAATPGTVIGSKLLQAGAEPRKALRLNPKVGDKQTSTMTLKMSMAIGEGEAMKMPLIKMAMDTTVKSASETEIAYETVMTDVSLAEDTDAMPQMVEAMKATMGGLKGMTVLGTMSKRGISKNVEVKATGEMTPQTRQAMEQMKDTFRNSGVAFPEEPIGVGAEWEVKQKVKSQGMTLDQTTVYELVSLEGERFTAKTTLTQDAANQAIENPAMPEMKMDLVKLTSKGGGDVTAQLSKLMPSQVTTKMRNETEMAVGTGDQKNTMTMVMNLDLQMESK